MRYTVILIIALLLLTPLTKADTLPVYAVSGSMSFLDGTNVTFSFLWTYTEQVGANEDGSSIFVGSFVPGSFIGSEGNIPLTLLGFEDGSTFFDMFDPSPGGLDFATDAIVGRLERSPLPITLVGAQMFGVPGGEGGPEVGTLVFTESPISTPEPASILLLLAAGPLFIPGRLRRRNPQRGKHHGDDAPCSPSGFGA